MLADGEGPGGWTPYSKCRISFLIALPLLTLQILFLVDIHGWSELFGYGLGMIVQPIAVVFWLAFLAGELVFRGKCARAIHKVPWFSAVMALAFTLFFGAGTLARSLVLRIPGWCLVSQAVEWPPTPEWRNKPRDGFFLRLYGRGNETSYEFSSGTLGWHGEETVGFSDIELKPLTFGRWEDGKMIVIPGSHQALRAGLNASNLEDENLDLLAADMWMVLQHAIKGEPLSSAGGGTGPLDVQPFGNEDVVLGGVLWMIAVVIIIGIIGQVTLPKADASRGKKLGVG